MRVLIKKDETNTFLVAEATSLELDSEEGGLLIDTASELYLISDIKRKKAEELIREAYVSGRVDLTAWDADAIDEDFMFGAYGETDELEDMDGWEDDD